MSSGGGARASSPDRGVGVGVGVGVGGSRAQRSSSVDRAARRGAGAARLPSRRVRVGIAAAERKVRARPMTQILGRIDRATFDVIIFSDELMRDAPVEEWPVVDCLLSWYSAGFPLAKAEAYVALRQPFCVNDLGVEHTLRDRRKFYAVLAAHGIPTPRHIVADREAAPDLRVVETDDGIEIGGVLLRKPFVEKPFDAEDHDVRIYYPRRLGGGSKRLFRKVEDRSSTYLPEESSIRRTGSYLYEE